MLGRTGQELGSEYGYRKVHPSRRDEPFEWILDDARDFRYDNAMAHC